MKEDETRLASSASRIVVKTSGRGSRKRPQEIAAYREPTSTTQNLQKGAKHSTATLRGNDTDAGVETGTGRSSFPEGRCSATASREQNESRAIFDAHLHTADWLLATAAPDRRCERFADDEVLHPRRQKKSVGAAGCSVDMPDTAGDRSRPNPRRDDCAREVNGGQETTTALGGTDRQRGESSLLTNGGGPSASQVGERRDGGDDDDANLPLFVDPHVDGDEDNEDDGSSSPARSEPFDLWKSNLYR
jgi:hypothetical protein